MQVSERTRTIAEERVEHAARIFDDGGNVDVEFTDRQNPRQADSRFRVEITSSAAAAPAIVAPVVHTSSMSTAPARTTVR